MIPLAKRLARELMVHRTHPWGLCTCLTTAAFVRLNAILARDKELVAVHIGAVVGVVCWSFTKVTFGNHAVLIIRDRNCKAVIKDKELAIPVLVALLVTIVNHTTI